MTYRNEDDEIIDTALDTLAWQRREIDRLTAENERLRELLDAWLGLAREHLDTELAGRTFEALERTRK